MGLLVIQDKDGNDRYMLQKVGKANTLCYELHFWKGATLDPRTKKPTKPGWRSMGKYPSTIEHGLQTIAQHIERDQEFKIFAKATPANLREAASEFSDIIKSFSARIVYDVEDKEGKAVEDLM